MSRLTVPADDLRPPSVSGGSSCPGCRFWSRRCLPARPRLLGARETVTALAAPLAGSAGLDRRSSHLQLACRSIGARLATRRLFTCRKHALLVGRVGVCGAGVHMGIHGRRCGHGGGGRVHVRVDPHRSGWVRVRVGFAGEAGTSSVLLCVAVCGPTSSCKVGCVCLGGEGAEPWGGGACEPGFWRGYVLACAMVCMYCFVLRAGVCVCLISPCGASCHPDYNHVITATLG